MKKLLFILLFLPFMSKAQIGISGEEKDFYWINKQLRLLYDSVGNPISDSILMWDPATNTVKMVSAVQIYPNLKQVTAIGSHTPSTIHIDNNGSFTMIDMGRTNAKGFLNIRDTATSNELDFLPNSITFFNGSSFNTTTIIAQNPSIARVQVLRNVSDTFAYGGDTVRAFASKYYVDSHSGGGGGSNFANADLTQTANRHYDGNYYDLLMDTLGNVSVSGGHNNGTMFFQNDSLSNRLELDADGSANIVSTNNADVAISGDRNITLFTNNDISLTANNSGITAEGSSSTGNIAINLIDQYTNSYYLLSGYQSGTQFPNLVGGEATYNQDTIGMSMSRVSSSIIAHDSTFNVDQGIDIVRGVRLRNYAGTDTTMFPWIGSNGSMSLRKIYSGGGGGGTPGGSTTQIQYNNSGAFAGSANLLWENSLPRLDIGAASTDPDLLSTSNVLITSGGYASASLYATSSTGGGYTFYGTPSATAFSGLNGSSFGGTFGGTSLSHNDAYWLYNAARSIGIQAATVLMGTMGSSDYQLQITSLGAYLGLGSTVSHTNTYAFEVAGTSLFTNYLTNSSTPSISAGAGAGTGPTISIVGTNNDGVITLTAGTLPTALGTIGTITFSSSFSFPNGCSVVITPTTSTTGLTGAVVGATGSTTGFTFNSVGLSSGTYSWNYHVGGY